MSKFWDIMVGCVVLTLIAVSFIASLPYNPEFFVGFLMFLILMVIATPELS